MKFNNLQAPHFIPQDEFAKLKKREKAYVYMIFVFKKRYTQKQIMDKLFIDSNRTFQRLQNKIRSIVRWQNVTK